MITVKEVLTKRELRKFVDFPNVIYNQVKYGEITFYAIKDGNRFDFEFTIQSI